MPATCYVESTKVPEGDRHPLSICSSDSRDHRKVQPDPTTLAQHILAHQHTYQSVVLHTHQTLHPSKSLRGLGRSYIEEDTAQEQRTLPAFTAFTELALTTPRKRTRYKARFIDTRRNSKHRTTVLSEHPESTGPQTLGQTMIAFSYLSIDDLRSGLGRYAKLFLQAECLRCAYGQRLGDSSLFITRRSLLIVFSIN